MTGDDGGPESMEWWDTLLEDMEATAAEYETQGWEALELHTADATPLDGEFGDRIGLSVLVPDGEFDRLRSLLDPGAVDGYDVYRTTVMGSVALLVALEDQSDEVAVLLPAYYATGDDSAERLFAQATAEGELRLFVRNLAEEQVTVTLEDPSLLAPPETADGNSDGETTGGDADE